MQGTCPAPYGGCADDVATPVTPSLQGLCSDDDLDAVRSACATGSGASTCRAAMTVLAATNAVCEACLSPFDEEFAGRSGLYRCAAPFVSQACNHATGCANDCAEASCSQCPDASEPQCREGVSGGQCSAYVEQASCAISALATGSLCSPFTYADYGLWLRAVGDHFCGNGP
jgi:hypothetical protein